MQLRRAEDAERTERGISRWRLYVSDDELGAMYRIAYRGPATSAG
jgi:hypothetical protein